MFGMLLELQKPAQGVVVSCAAQIMPHVISNLEVLRGQQCTTDPLACMDRLAKCSKMRPQQHTMNWYRFL